MRNWLVLTLFALTTLLSTSGLAQVSDDFSDGNLDNPTWQGDRDDFVVENGELQLRAPEAGTSTLSLATGLTERTDSVVYELLVRQAFSPSGSNKFTLILTADNGQEMQLQFGGISGSDDALMIDFDGQEVYTGPAGALGSDPAVCRLRLTRLNTFAESNFVVETDYTGGREFNREGSFSTAAAGPFTTFTLNCDYTATRADRFSFDDVLIRPGRSVVQPPEPPVLLITEFMADPNPVVGLPNAEYVEIYNAGDEIAELSTVSITSGGNPAALSGTLEPGGYAVVIDSDDAEEFMSLGVTSISTDLPGLSNSGDNITLLFGADTLASIDYTADWYNDPERNDGGYAIEYTSLAGEEAGCSGLWRASTADAGGTPGRENATLGQPNDSSGPSLVSTDIDVDGITLGFDEAPTELMPDFVLTNRGQEVMLAALTRSADGLTYSLSFTELLEEGTLYQLNLPSLTDCAGNVTETQDVELGIPSTPAPGEVVINEILFNPRTGGSDYVELFNCSRKIFQINGWEFSNAQSTGNPTEVQTSRLFLPGQYLTFTEDVDAVLNSFDEVEPSFLVDQDLPTLANSAGNITVRAGGGILDAFDYSEDLHSPLLDDVDGVALERVRAKSPTNSPANWSSPASSTRGGTPTRLNSQDRSEPRPDFVGGLFSVVNETFSPDQDGFEDVLEVSYADVPAGSLARVRIYDAQGRPTRTLRDIELLGDTGIFRWDGADDDGLRARVGIYVVYVELITVDGPVQSFKLPVVLAGNR